MPQPWEMPTTFRPGQVFDTSVLDGQREFANSLAAHQKLQAIQKAHLENAVLPAALKAAHEAQQEDLYKAHLVNEALPAKQAAGLARTQADTEVAHARALALPQQLQQGAMRLALGQANVGLRKKGIHARNIRSYSRMTTSTPGQTILSASPELFKTYADITSALGQSLGGQLTPEGAPAAPQSAVSPRTTPSAPLSVGALMGHPLDDATQQIATAPPYGGAPVQSAQAPTSDQLTPSQLKSAQDLLKSGQIKKTTAGQVALQRKFAVSVNKLLNDVQPDMPAIAHFAGLAGRAHMSASRFAAAANLKTSPEYLKFHNFVTTKAKIISNEMRKAMGGQATDAEIKLVSNLVNPIYWDNNPTLALSQFHALRTSLDQIEKSLVLSQAGTLGALKKHVAATAKTTKATAVPPKRVLMIEPKTHKKWYLPHRQMQAAISEGWRVG